MAVNRSRRLNPELREGMTDGSYFKVLQNWGGTPDPGDAITIAQRQAWTEGNGFCQHEAPVKIAADGQRAK